MIKDGELPIITNIILSPEESSIMLHLLNVIIVNPNLPDPMNFVAFGMMRYSLFDINLMSITYM